MMQDNDDRKGTNNSAIKLTSYYCCSSDTVIIGTKGVGLPTGVAMREKKSGALSRMQKLRKRLSHSFGRLFYVIHSTILLVA
ncbi:hypothetical protein QE152_g29814 [Popillia japonica]|uniref:Uncharacterized protein n=1 Tax=Popillia japonica TaxID=7064 RepID=A0AAW1JFW4_POPJA